MKLGGPLATAVLHRRSGVSFPASLFSAGQKGLWFDPSDLSSMFQNSNGTTAVAVGDPVGYIADKSGHNNHAIQATAGQRPILRLTGGLYYLEFDNSNDWIGVPANTLSGNFTSAMDVVFSAMHSGDTVSFSSTFTAVPLFAAAITGDGAAATSGSGSPTYNVNGTAVPGGAAVTRAQLTTAWPNSVAKEVEVIGLDLTGWADASHGFGWGEWTGIAGFRNFYGCIVRETLSAPELANVRTWMGAKCGAAL